MGYLIIFMKSLYAQKLKQITNDLAEDPVTEKKKKNHLTFNSTITVSTAKNYSWNQNDSSNSHKLANCTLRTAFQKTKLRREKQGFAVKVQY